MATTTTVPVAEPAAAMNYADEIKDLKKMLHQLVGENETLNPKVAILSPGDHELAQANLRHADHIASEAKARMAIPIIPGDSSSTTLFAGDMYVNSRALFDELKKDAPDIEYMKEKAAQMVCHATTRLAGYAGAQELSAPINAKFTDAYYLFSRGADATKRAADWEPDQVIQVERKRMKAVVNSLNAAAENKYGAGRNTRQQGYFKGYQQQQQGQQRGGKGFSAGGRPWHKSQFHAKQQQPNDLPYGPMVPSR